MLSSADILTLLLIHSGISFTKIKKKGGRNTETWNLPLDISTQSECSPFTTLNLRPRRKDLIRANNCPSTYKLKEHVCLMSFNKLHS